MLKNVSIVATVKLIGVLFSTVITLFLANYLNLTDFGLYSYLLSLSIISSVVAVVGFPDYIIKQFSAIKNCNRKLILNTSRISLFILSILIGSFLISVNIHKYGNFIFFIILLILLHGLTSINASVLIAIKIPLKSLIPEQIIRPLLFTILVVIYKTLEGKNELLFVFIVYSLSYIILNLIYLIIIHKNLILDETIDKQKKLDFSLLKESYPFLFIGISLIIYTKVDILLIGTLLELDDVSLYRIAVSGASIASLVQFSINRVLTPYIREYIDNGNLSQLNKLTLRLVRFSTLISLIFLVLLVFFGKLGINLFLRKEYLGALGAMIILTVGQIIHSATGPAGNILNVLGYEKITLYCFTFSAILNIIFNIIIIPFLGISGAALATCSSMVINKCLLSLFLYKKTKINSTILGSI